MKNQKISPTKISASLIILLVISVLTPLSIVAASNGNDSEQGQQTQNGNASSPTPTMNQSQTTNMQGNNVASNGSQITQRQQIQAREQTQMQLRNMTMLMNCTSNCELVLSSDDKVAPQDFQLSLDSNQTMKLHMNLSRNPLNGAMINQRALNFYLGIEPNATNRFQAQIRLHINQTELSQSLNREVNASRLTWMYWNQTNAQWEAVESYMDQNGYLTCNTDHFSTWTVAEIETNHEPTPSTQSSSIPIEYVVIAAAIALVVVASGIVAYKKRK